MLLPIDERAEEDLTMHSALRNSSYGRHRLSYSIELPVAC